MGVNDFGFEFLKINPEIRRLKEFLFWIQKAKGQVGGFEQLVPSLRMGIGVPKPNSADTYQMKEVTITYLGEISDNPNVTPYQGW